MAEEHKKEEERDDASAGTLLKTAIDRMDALHKRLDAMEEERKSDSRRKDSEEEERKDRARKDSEKEEREDSKRADKARKDESEEEEEKEERKDAKSRKDSEKEEREDSTVFYRGNKAPKTSTKSDSEKEEEEREDSKARKDEDEEAMADSFSKVAERIARVERMLPAQLSDEDRAKFSEVQARADSVFHAFGSAAPAPLQGETLLGYRQRLANSLKSHSKTFKDVNVYAIGDAVAFNAIEEVVYNDAMGIAMSPATAPAGTLRAISKKSGGHEFITYVGDPAAWMNEFAGPVRQYATAINTPNAGQR